MSLIIWIRCPKALFYHGGCYSLLHDLFIDYIAYRDRKKERGTKEFEELKHLSKKIQGMISNIFINEKNEKLCQNTGIPGIQEAFSDKVTLDIDGFTVEPVVQCDVQVTENTFIDDSK